MKAQDLTVEINLSGLPGDAESVIQGFTFTATSEIGLEFDLISGVVIDPDLKGAEAKPEGTGADQKFKIRLSPFVFWSIYRCIKLKADLKTLDGADQLNIYIFYHELGHCVDERNRAVFNRQDPSDDESYDRSKCSEWNEQVLLSEYAASHLAAENLGKEGFVQEVEDFQRLEGKIIREAKGMPVEQQAYYTWKLLLEYAKLSAVAHKNDWPRPTCMVEFGLSQEFRGLHKKLGELWADYPNWQHPLTGATSLWLTVSQRLGITGL